MITIRNKHKGKLGLAMLLLLGVSCSKSFESENRQVINTNFGNTAKFQVYNTSPGVQRNFVYSDGVPLTGTAIAYTTVSNFLGSGVTFSLVPGLHNIVVRDTLASSTQPINTFPITVESNTSYTLFLYDTANAVKYKYVTNEILPIADTSARVRFAYFPYRRGGTPPNVDLYSKLNNRNIFENVAYTDVTGYINYRSSMGLATLNDSLFLRVNGTMNNLDTLVFNPRQKAHTTVVYRGRYGLSDLPANANLLPGVLATFTSQ